MERWNGCDFKNGFFLSMGSPPVEVVRRGIFEVKKRVYPPKNSKFFLLGG